ncbi:MAG: hypothetical protein WBP83_13525 [Nitrososphaeraceae archaeon]
MVYTPVLNASLSTTYSGPIYVLDIEIENIGVGSALAIKPFMVSVVRDRRDNIISNPSSIQTYPWPTTKPYYNLRKMLDHLGYNISETYPLGHKLEGKVILAERRPYIQGKMLTDICEKDFGMKRHQLGIFTDERSQFVYRGESQSVGYYDIDSLIKKGTDIILAEKAYVVKLLAPLAESYGIALLESGGNFVEYARMLCEKAVRRGCNVALLTDFDISGIAMCINIPWAIRIGIDTNTVNALGFTKEQIRLVQERYNADPNQMKFVTNVLDRNHNLITEEYNLNLIETLSLGQRRTLEYLTNTRIELDHVIDEAGPERFFEYVINTLEKTFTTRNYNYAVELPYINELRPPIMKEFVARMDKLIQEIPAFQPKLREIKNRLRNGIDGLREIDGLRQKEMIDPLIETEEADPKVKQLLHKLAGMINDLPELTEEEKLDL